MTITHSEMKKLYLIYLDDDVRSRAYDLPIEELFARALRRIPDVLDFNAFRVRIADRVEQLNTANQYEDLLSRGIIKKPATLTAINEPVQTAPTPGKCGKPIHGGKFCNRLPEHDKPSKDAEGKAVGATPCSTIPF